MLLLADTTVLIDVLRGDPASQRLAERISTGDLVCTSVITVDEIVRGMKPSEESYTRSLFAGILVLDIREREAWIAGQWRRDFAQNGFTLTQADCLIASTAYHYNATLVTGNPTDFPMQEIIVEHWPVGQ